MKRLNCYLFFFAMMISAALSGCQSKYKYESVPNDPLQTRIYTLDK